MARKYYGLIDCNNFFASCERIFRPDLRGRPVAVLSNNDGVIVARTQEVKDLGVPMAGPYFKHADILKQHNVHILSANFALYSDISKRIIHILTEVAPEVEVYSIDECFISLEVSPEVAKNWATEVKNRVLKDTGAPVSIGLAPTKTLAKAAAEYAKKHPQTEGVKMIENAPFISAENLSSYSQVLKWLEVGDVWGIGRKLATKLNRSGVYNTWQLAQVSNEWARSQLTIRGEKTVRELRGEVCYGLNENESDPQKTILVSRSFAEPVRNLSELQIAVASFAVTMAHKLRRKKRLATAINVFANSSKHRGGRLFIRGQRRFDIPTSDSAIITKAVTEELEKAFISGGAYKRAGVYVGELVGRDGRQMNLFSDVTAEDIDAEIRRGQALDEIINRYGTTFIKTGAAIENYSKEKWRSRADSRSPEYTTMWNQIAVVKAKRL